MHTFEICNTLDSLFSSSKFKLEIQIHFFPRLPNTSSLGPNQLSGTGLSEGLVLTVSGQDLRIWRSNRLPKILCEWMCFKIISQSLIISIYSSIQDYIAWWEEHGHWIQAIAGLILTLPTYQQLCVLSQNSLSKVQLLHL